MVARINAVYLVLPGSTELLWMKEDGCDNER